jgi:hypothetical protein
MGTAIQWTWVASGAIFYGGFMVFLTTRRRISAQIEPSLSSADILGWALMGLASVS